ncbi:hypothetical protein ABQF35_14345 [Mycobacterium syngnathidarum]
MYYLLKPDITVYWTDISEYTIERLAKHADVTIDYNRFDWQPAERPFDAGTLNIALRYGKPTNTGIAVAGRDLVELDHYRTMAALVQNETQRDDPSTAPGAALMEAISPGWTESSRELDQRVLESTRQTAARAERDMLEAFNKPLDPALAEHWQKLGGSIPTQPPA